MGKDEAGSTVSRAVAQACPSESHAKTVEFLAGFCNAELLSQMLAVFPSLQCVCEDPVHVVMKLKSSIGHRTTRASALLGHILPMLF